MINASNLLIFTAHVLALFRIQHKLRQLLNIKKNVKTPVWLSRSSCRASTTKVVPTVV